MCSTQIVLVSAALARIGPPAPAVREAGRRLRPIISPALCAEYEAVLSRSKFDRLDPGGTRWRSVLQALLRTQDLVYPTERVTLCRNPKDNIVSESAIAGETEIIVTGDGDLLVLSPFRGIEILKPADLIPRLAAMQ